MTQALTGLFYDCALLRFTVLNSVLNRSALRRLLDAINLKGT